ncbi:hypothetical protein B1A_08650 [mine drainage metagenome]|uniref:Rhamnosyl O-methyltransferase n=1 Tax=mine drainage metagenome TaxID=410659 RepID=T1B938_9ZZZZ
MISFDLGVKYGNSDEMPVGFAISEELKAKWNLIIGDSSTTLIEQLEKYKTINMFFHDSNHTYEHVTFELETVYPYLSNNFLVVVDNYDWSEATKNFAAENDLKLVHVSDDMCFIIN